MKINGNISGRLFRDIFIDNRLIFTCYANRRFENSILYSNYNMLEICKYTNIFRIFTTVVKHYNCNLHDIN